MTLENLTTNFDETLNKSQIWIKDKNEDFVSYFKQLDVWTQLAVGVTALEYAFQRIPLISIPAVILDVGGGLGNLFQKINSKEVTCTP